MTLSDAKRCAYLGPAATFTEAALIDLLTEHDLLDTVERVPMRSQNEMFDAVRSGEVDAAVVPIENSVEGGVPATLDALTRSGNLQIVAEAVVPVRFVLAAQPHASPRRGADPPVDAGARAAGRLPPDRLDGRGRTGTGCGRPCGRRRADVFGACGDGGRRRADVLGLCGDGRGVLPGGHRAAAGG
jgi:hypothetical protein